MTDQATDMEMILFRELMKMSKVQPEIMTVVGCGETLRSKCLLLPTRLVA